MKHTLRYPKLLLLATSFIAAYVLYMQGFFDLLPEVLNGHGYISMFLGGLLFSFGFTTPFAIAIFIEMADYVDPFLGAIIAGFGAMLADMTIFQFVRLSFLDELHHLKASAMFKWMGAHLHSDTIPARMRRYATWSAAGMVIASPLPDEIGVTMLSGLTKIQSSSFAVICFAFNTGGILLMLLAARILGA